MMATTTQKTFLTLVVISLLGLWAQQVLPPLEGGVPPFVAFWEVARGVGEIRLTPRRCRRLARKWIEPALRVGGRRMGRRRAEWIRDLTREGIEPNPGWLYLLAWTAAKLSGLVVTATASVLAVVYYFADRVTASEIVDAETSAKLELRFVTVPDTLAGRTMCSIQRSGLRPRAMWNSFKQSFRVYGDAPTIHFPARIDERQSYWRTDFDTEGVRVWERVRESYIQSVRRYFVQCYYSQASRRYWWERVAGYLIAWTPRSLSDLLARLARCELDRAVETWESAKCRAVAGREGFLVHERVISLRELLNDLRQTFTYDGLRGVSWRGMWLALRLSRLGVILGFRYVCRALAADLALSLFVLVASLGGVNLVLLQYRLLRLTICAVNAAVIRTYHNGLYLFVVGPQNKVDWWVNRGLVGILRKLRKSPLGSFLGLKSTLVRGSNGLGTTPGLTAQPGVLMIANVHPVTQPFPPIFATGPGPPVGIPHLLPQHPQAWNIFFHDATSDCSRIDVRFAVRSLDENGLFANGLRYLVNTDADLLSNGLLEELAASIDSPAGGLLRGQLEFPKPLGNYVRSGLTSPYQQVAGNEVHALQLKGKDQFEAVIETDRVEMTAVSLYEPAIGALVVTWFVTYKPLFQAFGFDISLMPRIGAESTFRCRAETVNGKVMWPRLEKYDPTCRGNNLMYPTEVEGILTSLALSMLRVGNGKPVISPQGLDNLRRKARALCDAHYTSAMKTLQTALASARPPRNAPPLLSWYQEVATALVESVCLNAEARASEAFQDTLVHTREFLEVSNS